MDDSFSFFGFLLGAVGWFSVVYVLRGFFTVQQNERAVKTSFGRAIRKQTTTLDNPMAEFLRPDERERYKYPQLEVIPPAARTSSGRGRRSTRSPWPPRR